MQLLKKKREKDANQLLNQIVTNPEREDLVIALKHNQFGGFCLQADDLEKALPHFEKALAVVEEKYKLPMSNAHMNIGNVYGQKRDYKRAIEYYVQAIEKSPHNPINSKIEIPKQSPLADCDPSIIFSTKLNNEVAYIDAHTNLAVMYIQVD